MPYAVPHHLMVSHNPKLSGHTFGVWVSWLSHSVLWLSLNISQLFHTVFWPSHGVSWLSFSNLSKGILEMCFPTVSWCCDCLIVFCYSKLSIDTWGVFSCWVHFMTVLCCLVTVNVCWHFPDISWLSTYSELSVETLGCALFWVHFMTVQQCPVTVSVSQLFPGVSQPSAYSKLSIETPRLCFILGSFHDCLVVFNNCPMVSCDSLLVSLGHLPTQNYQETLGCFVLDAFSTVMVSWNQPMVSSGHIHTLSYQKRQLGCVFFYFVFIS